MVDGIPQLYHGGRRMHCQHIKPFPKRLQPKWQELSVHVKYRKVFWFDVMFGVVVAVSIMVGITITQPNKTFLSFICACQVDHLGRVIMSLYTL